MTTRLGERPRLALFFFAVFAIVGVSLPFWPVWLRSRGLDAAEIATLFTLGHWAKVVANPLLGLAADRRGAARVMRWLTLVALGSFAILLLPLRGFASVLLLAILGGTCLSAVTPLGERVALAVAYAGGGDYGRLRLWGSLGFIGAALLTGWLLPGGDADLILYAVIAGTALLVMSCLVMPSPGRDTAGAPGMPAVAFLARPSFLAFLCAATLIQGSHAVYYTFATLYWRDRGIGDATIAALWVEGVAAEIALFYWSRPVLARLGPLRLLALGGGAGVLRWSLTAATDAPMLLALVQLLHALTFGAAHLGAMHHIARVIPAAQAATAQGLYSAVVNGVGAGLATLAAGALYAASGGGAFLGMAAMAALGGAGALLLAATKS